MTEENKLKVTADVSAGQTQWLNGTKAEDVAPPQKALDVAQMNEIRRGRAAHNGTSRKPVGPRT